MLFRSVVEPGQDDRKWPFPMSIQIVAIVLVDHAQLGEAGRLRGLGHHVHHAPAIELGRGTQDEVVERTTRFIRTLPQVLHKFNAPLESADLRHAEGYAVKLKGLSVAADAKQPQQASGKQ